MCVCVCGCVCVGVCSSVSHMAIGTTKRCSGDCTVGGQLTEGRRNLYDVELDYWCCTADSVTVIGGTGNM